MQPYAVGGPIDSEHIAEFSDNWNNLYINQNENPVVYLIRRYVNEGYSFDMPRYILANKLVNTSKFNLSTAVQKSSTNNMTVEYTLTEVTS